MAESSNIEWTDSTFNPWEGCLKVGPGCDHCYAEDRNARFAGGVATNWGAGAPRRRTGASNWQKPLAWNAQHAEFLALHGRRRRVFCASLGDWLDNEAPVEWRVDLLRLIFKTKNLDWLLLSKRIGNFVRALNEARRLVDFERERDFWLWIKAWENGEEVPAHVWVGATIVNQEEADRDIPKLLAAPAVRRFLSMEPLLGPVDIVPFIGGRAIQCGCGFRRDEFSLAGATLAREGCMICNKKTVTRPTVDWVIVGGESGPGARPMHPAWARSLRDQCHEVAVPFLFKQWGEWAPAKEVQGLAGRTLVLEGTAPFTDRPKWHEFECGQQSARIGKKAAGRLLDGRAWDGYPEGCGAPESEVAS